MSYRVRFEDDALVQLNGLPSAAFDALLQRAVDVAGEPWDATVMPPLARILLTAWQCFGADYDEIAAGAGIDVRYHTEVTSGGGGGRLAWLRLQDIAAGTTAKVDAGALIMTGPTSLFHPPGWRRCSSPAFPACSQSGMLGTGR